MRRARLGLGYLGVIAIALVSTTPRTLATGMWPSFGRGGGPLVVARDGYVEEIRQLPNGWEQSFHFAAEPPGDGPLHLSIRPTGLSYAGASEGWMHFASLDPPTSAVRYGAATWVDRDGVATNVQMAFSDGEIGLDVPRAILRASAYPAVLDPTMEYLAGAEQAFGDPGDSPSADARSALTVSPLVASFGVGETVVVWGDSRNDGLYGARVNAQGASLDRVGVPLVPALGIASLDGTTGAVLPASLASDGASNVLLASAIPGETHIVRASPLTLTGAALSLTNAGYLLGSGTFAVTAGPAATWDGNDFVVVWASDQIRLTRVDPKRGSLDLANTALVDGRPTSIAVACQPDGSECLVAWDGPTFARFVPGGALLDLLPIRISNSASAGIDVAAAWDFVNQKYIITWLDDGLGRYGATVSPSGSVGTTVALPEGAVPGCGARGCFLTYSKLPTHTGQGPTLYLASLDAGLSYSGLASVGCPNALLPAPTVVSGTFISVAALCFDTSALVRATVPSLVGGLIDPSTGVSSVHDVFAVGPEQENPVVVTGSPQSSQSAALIWKGGSSATSPWGAPTAPSARHSTR